MHRLLHIRRTQYSLYCVSTYIWQTTEWYFLFNSVSFSSLLCAGSPTHKVVPWQGEQSRATHGNPSWNSGLPSLLPIGAYFRWTFHVLTRWWFWWHASITFYENCTRRLLTFLRTLVHFSICSLSSPWVWPSVIMTMLSGRPDLKCWLSTNVSWTNSRISPILAAPPLK